MGHVANEVQGNRHRKLPCQAEQAKVVHTLRSGKKVDNGISCTNDDDEEDVGRQRNPVDTAPADGEKEANEAVHGNVANGEASRAIPLYALRSRQYGRVPRDDKQCNFRQNYGESSYSVPLPFP